MKTRLLGGIAIATLGFLTLTEEAEGWPFIYNTWNSLYPTSMTDDNLENAGGSRCQTCHQGENGGAPWNPYGFRVRMGVLATGDITMGILMAENFQSDMDPTGTINIDEIDASTQPGWTDGPNNTVFYADGTPVSGQLPPAADGTYDPAIYTSYCSPAVPNTSGDPGSISVTGSPDAAANDITLTATDLPQQQFGYFLTSQTQGLVMNPGGSTGNLCLGGSIGRFVQQVQNSGAGGEFSVAIDLTAMPVSPTAPVLSGETWNFQAWFRDVGNTSNFTDAASVAFL